MRVALCAGHRRSLDAADVLPKLREIADAHIAGTRFGIHVDPADGLLVAGSRGLSAHMDGCQGGRLGGNAAAREGGRDQCAVVQRALPAERIRWTRKNQAPETYTVHWRQRARESFNRRFWNAESRLPVRRGGRRIGRRTPGNDASAAQSALCHLARKPGARRAILGGRWWMQRRSFC